MTNVTLHTSMGDIKIKMYKDMPVTTGNFIKLAKEGFYTGTIFHRVIKNFMIQGGDPTGTGCGGPGYCIQDEFVKGHSNARGTVAMANTGQPNSGGSQFFINTVDNSYLDWDNPRSPSAHPVFGQIVDEKSMSVVDNIGKCETGRGDKPVKDIRITAVDIEERGEDMSRHVMEALGKSRIVIENGKITEVSEPIVKYCPLFKKQRNIEELNCETIRENMEYRIEHFGMCTEDRKIRMHYFLNFGISEILSLALANKMLDAVVIAADGCGTVVLDDPEIVQGMGGRISGIIETEPIRSVIEGIGYDRPLDPETAEIDQFGGVNKAFAMHYSRVGVTVASAEEAQEIRDCFGHNVAIMAVHTTGTSMEDAERFFECCDVITSCASKTIRDVARTKAVLQAGTKVPVYAATETGAELITAKLKELGRKPDTVLEDGPFPLI